MKLLRTVPADTNIQFINKRYVAMALSLALVLSSVMLYSFKGLNLGIDFLGGVMLEVKTKGPADIANLRSRVSNLGLGDVSLQRFGQPGDATLPQQVTAPCSLVDLMAVARISPPTVSITPAQRPFKRGFPEVSVASLLEITFLAPRSIRNCFSSIFPVTATT